jgi:hypothetical protein
MVIFPMSGILSPRRRLYPPAWKPYGLEAEPEAADFRLRLGRGSITLIELKLNVSVVCCPLLSNKQRNYISATGETQREPQRTCKTTDYGHLIGFWLD